MKKLIALFLVAIMVFSIVSCVKSEADKVTEDDEKESMTEAETKESNPLEKIIRISLDRYNGKGMFQIYFGDRNGLQNGASMMGVTRFLYRTKKSTEYGEITVSSIGAADGTGIAISEGNELLHIIVVFKKDYKLTENDKNVLKEFGIDYMFEK